MNTSKRWGITLTAILVPLLSLACNLSTDLLPSSGGVPASSGGGAPAFSGGDQQTAEWDAWLDVPADPLRLDITTDDAHAASAVLDYSGGTLETTDAGGTTYRLEIPEGALDVPILISMTPLSSIQGMPFDQAVAHAVSLEPEGLRLADVAILTITPSSPIPVDQQIFFGFRGDDHQFGFVPTVPNTIQIQFPIFHFSGYGVDKGLLADTEPVRKRLGGDMEERLNALLADQLAQESQLVQSGKETDAEFRKNMSVFLDWLIKTYIREVLTPRLNAAGESCAAGKLVIQTGLGFARQMTLFGAPPDKVNAIIKSILDVSQQAIERCLQEEYELCRDQHIIHRIRDVVLSMAREQQLLGVTAGGDVLAKGMDLARKCLTFELDFESAAQVDTPGVQTRAESAVESKVQLNAVPSEGNPVGAIEGESALKDRTFTIESPFCSLNPSRGGSTLQVQGLTWEVAFNKDDEIGHVKDLTLTFTSDPTTESWTGNCTVGGVTFPYEAPSANVWSSTYGTLHAQECKASSAGGADNPPTSGGPSDLGSLLGQMGDTGDLSPEQIQGLMGALQGGVGAPGTAYGCGVEHDWQVQGGETFATKEWNLSSSSPLQMSEQGSFVLKHLPR
jgi:hypothetical protein